MSGICGDGYDTARLFGVFYLGWIVGLCVQWATSCINRGHREPSSYMEESHDTWKQRDSQKS